MVRIKYLSVTGPRKNIATRTTIRVKEVLMERAIVELTLLLIMVCKSALFLKSSKFSLILSKTTIVSWTENPIMNKSATIKLVSISTPNFQPKTASIPAGMTTSCERLIKTAIPYFQDFIG
jgi:hypothetical protein